MVIPVELSTAVTVAGALLAIGGTWKVMGYRLRMLEAQVSRLEGREIEAARRVTELDKLIDHVRENQGRRIGQLEKQSDSLGGELAGFRHGVELAERRLHVVKNDLADRLEQIARDPG